MQCLFVLSSLLYLLHWLHIRWCLLFYSLSNRKPLCLFVAFHLPGSHSQPLLRYFSSKLDRISLWSASGPSHAEVVGGYNFALSWRYSLSGVHSSALGLYNFKTGPNSYLGFTAELKNMTNNGGFILFKPIGAQANIVFLAFSVIVVTQDTNFIEVLAFSLNPGVATYANSSKFSFTTTTYPIYYYFIQWVTSHDTAEPSWIAYSA